MTRGRSGFLVVGTKTALELKGAGDGTLQSVNAHWEARAQPARVWGRHAGVDGKPPFQHAPKRVDEDGSSR